MTGSNKKQDMSIEEILRSIKGIINEEQTYNHAIVEEDEDVLELTNIVGANETDKGAESNYAQNDTEAPLVSKKIADETANIFQQYAKVAGSSNSAKNTEHQQQGLLKNKEQILEDLVTEIIRPMLSAWLDENLPTIVRQLVDKEIKRLAEQTLPKK